MKDLYPLELKVFIKKAGPDLRITSFRLVMFSALILLITLVLNHIFEGECAFNKLIPIAGFCVIIGVVWNYFEHETKHLEFFGLGAIKTDLIHLEKDPLMWSNVVRVCIGPVLKEDVFNWALHIGPKYSAGLDSFFELEDGRRFHFLLETYREQSRFERIIKDQYLRGNLALETVYDGLKLDYEEIQELKRAKSNV